MRRNIIVAVVLLILCAPSQAQVLWYNGQFDTANGLANMRKPSTEFRTYDDFTVPAGQTWDITGVLMEGFSLGLPASFDWEIRSGISKADGGIILGSGSDQPGTFVPTGRFNGTSPEYHYETAASLALGPGTYWLMVRPVASTQFDFYVSTTSGQNSVGTPAGNDNNAFLASTTGAYNFLPTTLIGAEYHDFALGIQGTVRGANHTPEPSLVVFLAAGATTALALMLGRRSKRVD